MTLSEQYEKLALKRSTKRKLTRSINFRAFVQALDPLLVETRCYKVKAEPMDESYDKYWWAAFDSLGYPITTTDFHGIHTFFQQHKDPFLLNGFDQFIDRYAKELPNNLVNREKIVLMGSKAYEDAKKNPSDWSWTKGLDSWDVLEKASLTRLLAKPLAYY